MKKSVFFMGLGFMLTGLTLLFFGIYGPDIPFEIMLWALGGAGIGSGVMLIFNYLYYLVPKNKASYGARVQEAKINLKDERKIMLRDKSGRISYIIIFFLLAFLIVAFSIMKVDSFILITLLILWVFMYFCKIIVYKILDKKLY